MQIKTAMSYHLTFVSVALSTRQEIVSIREDVEKEDPRALSPGTVNWDSLSGKQCEGSSKKIKNRITHFDPASHFGVFIQRKALIQKDTHPPCSLKH